MLRLAPLVLLPALALSACGGSDGSAPDPRATSAGPDGAAPTSAVPTSAAPTSAVPTSAAPTRAALVQDRAAYVAASEAVCRTGLAEYDELDKAFDGPESGWGAALRRQVAQGERVSDELEALAAARPDRAELQRAFLGPLRQQLADVTAFLPQFEADLAADRKPGEPSLTKADERAMRAYGFDACLDWASTE